MSYCNVAANCALWDMAISKIPQLYCCFLSVRKGGRGKSGPCINWVKRKSAATCEISDDMLTLVNSLSPGWLLYSQIHGDLSVQCTLPKQIALLLCSLWVQRDLSSVSWLYSEITLYFLLFGTQLPIWERFPWECSRQTVPSLWFPIRMESSLKLMLNGTYKKFRYIKNWQCRFKL